MHVSGKLFGWVSAAVILTYVAVVALGFFMPLQTDEVSSLILNHRAWIDGKTLIGLHPQCGKSTFSNPLPFLWYVPAFVSYLTYGQIDNPIWVRIAGIAQFLVWLTLWVAIAMKLFAVSWRRWWAVLAVILGFLGWDALPLVFLVSRPEQIVLIGTGTAVAMALYADDLCRRPALRLICTLLSFFIMLCMHSSHPKSAALLPLELIMYGTFFERAWRTRAATVLGLMAIAWIAIQSYSATLLRIQCPDAPEVTEFFQDLYLPLDMLWHAPGTFLISAAKNIFSASIADFYLDIYFHVSHIWLPLSLRPVGPLMDSLIQTLDVEAWFIHFLCLAASVFICLRYIAAYLRRQKEQPAHGEARHLPCLSALLLFIVALLTLISEGIYYSVALMIPLVLLATFLSARIILQAPWNHRFLARFVIVLLLGAVLNQSFLLYRYGGFIASTENAAFSALKINHMGLTSAFDYEKTRTNIMATAAQCHISAEHSEKHLVVDDVTYHAFHNTFQPLFLATSSWICCHKQSEYSHPGKKPLFSLPRYLALLRQYDSDGIVARCESFPDSLRGLSIEHAGFCCIPKSVLVSPVSGISVK